MLRSKRAWRAWVAATVVCLSAAACGSTVSIQSQQRGDATDQGLGNVGPNGQATPGNSPGRPGGLVTTPEGGGAAAGSTGGSVGSTANGPGITATTIQLGIPYCNECAAGNAALGGGGDDPGDTREYYKTAIADVNARGGVLGRKLVPIFQEARLSDSDTSGQAACDRFTKDNKVFAIFSRGEIMFECAKQAGIMAVGDAGSGPVYARYLNVFAPWSIRLERLGAITVKAMFQSGWHKPESRWPTGKIGLLTWDSTDYRYAMKHGSLATLHQVGLKESDVRYVAVAQSDSSVADASAAISSAVLAFKAQRIDHVFIADGPAGIFSSTGLTFMFLQIAKSQGYYPRYAMNAYNLPGWENHPPDQQSGMLAVDSFDGTKSADDGIALNPKRERCFELMRRAGLKVSDLQTSYLAIQACQIAWFTEAVLERSRGTFLPDVITAAESLGTSYRDPLSYGNRIGPGQHDGAALVRNSRFDDACACMKYTSKPYEP